MNGRRLRRAGGCAVLAVLVLSTTMVGAAGAPRSDRPSRAPSSTVSVLPAPPPPPAVAVPRPQRTGPPAQAANSASAGSDRPGPLSVDELTTGDAVSPGKTNVGVTATGAAKPSPKPSPSPSAPGVSGAGLGARSTLVLYDSTGPYAWLGEAYAQQTANLVSHFGTWTALPVGSYTSGRSSQFDATVYIGSTYDEPLPQAFLDDAKVLAKPLVWIYNNIWQLTAADPTFQARTGLTWEAFDLSPVAGVRYKETLLHRSPDNKAGILRVSVTGGARVLAEAERSDGSRFPWAVRAGNLTYIGEVPFSYVDHGDRYLAVADLLFDVLQPAAAQRQRALVRLEDVGPDADPVALTAMADYLAAEGVPFSVAVYPRYADPKGVYNGGTPELYDLKDAPAVVTALKHMQSKGGTLVLHGYTHQYGELANPYTGVSGDDFEFYTAHVDAADRVVYDGPVPGDSARWVNGRLDAASRALSAVGLTVPTVFEFPHYAGSALDYKTVGARFPRRYDRGLYFAGQFSGGAIDHTRLHGQYFPYPVRDVYGTVVVPENIGNVTEAYNQHPARTPADLVQTARLNKVVRDGYASFFYHPYLGIAGLKAVVDGVRAEGYTFVPSSSVQP